MIAAACSYTFQQNCSTLSEAAEEEQLLGLGEKHGAFPLMVATRL